MTPEWMIAFDRQKAAMRRLQRDPFADPLEREEWRGMQGVNTLFSRWLGNDGRQPRKARQEPVSSWIFAFGTASRRSRA